jgi:ribosomal protein S18 acetylase RimI-like enzyme
MVTIRAATADDIPDIRAVGASAWRDTYTGLVPDGYVEAGLAQGWTAEHFAESLANPAYRVLVAEDAGWVVGVAQAAIGRDGTGHLWRLYLLREARGCGFGRALWEAVAAAFSASPTRWETSVVVGNPALAFYQRLGFRVTRAGTWAAYGYEVPLTYLTRESAPGKEE